MILSVSRRTDIPAFYTPWFVNRIREGFVLVRNPMNYHQVSKVNLSPDVIDCIIFWTKDATPILPHLSAVGEIYPFYFQYTLNAYGKEMEASLPEPNEKIATFRKLSEQIGSERVIWRYDPVLLSDRYTVEWHMEQFRKTAQSLTGYTKRCIISFVDLYEKVKKNLNGLNARECSDADIARLAASFSETAREYGLVLQTCAERVDLRQYGIVHGSCVDAELIAKIIGWKLNAKKDPNQRSECGCVESLDIGQYNTCRHGCRYCYATFNPQSVATFSERHDPTSPFLIGGPEEEDKVTERKMKGLKIAAAGQISMF